MVVIAKDFVGGAYGAVQDEFEKHWTAIDGIPDMMMVAEDTGPNSTRIYVLLPNNTVPAFYDEFVEVEQSSLPKEVSLLVGYNHDFEKRFSYPSRV